MSIQLIQQAICYMEEHIYEDINYADFAELEKLLSNGYSIWETEPADYAVFKCVGPDGNCIGETWSKFFKEFAPQAGYMQTDDTDYEIYYENGESGLFCELWVPVKKN